MTRIRISCPHCSQKMQVNQDDAARKLRCTQCGKTFRLADKEKGLASSSVPIQYIDVDEDKTVQRVECFRCQKPFGLKTETLGKKISCPSCKESQRFEPTPQFVLEPAKDSEDMVKQKKKERIRKRKEKENLSRQSPDVEAGETSQNDNGDSPPDTTSSADTETGLLPPRYVVSADVEREVAAEIGFVPGRKEAFGLDTQTTRIQSGGQFVKVMSLSATQKLRRRQIRVAIVYLFSVMVLVALFVWLLNRVNT